MRALVLRLDAPLMSFGTVIVDHHGFIDPFPGIAPLTGLFANALGWNHTDWDLLQDLQNRLDFVARWDVRPTRIIDYQTANLGDQKMRIPGWTTRGVPEHRFGGPVAKYGTHQRYRHYWSDGLMTVVVSLVEGAYDIDRIRHAVERPARPLFLGRKACLPSRPLLDPVTPVQEGPDLLTVLQAIPVWDRSGRVQDTKEPKLTCWSQEKAYGVDGERRLVYDLRDWRNQLPAGSRWRMQGMIGGEE